MKSTILLTIEKIDGAPFKFEKGELDFTLKNEPLKKYLELNGENGINNIKDFLKYVGERIEMSYSGNRNNL